MSSKFVEREKTGDTESGVRGRGVVPAGMKHRASGPWAERGGRTGRAASRSCCPSAVLEAEHTWWIKA